MSRTLIRKLSKCFNEYMKFFIKNKTTKLVMFCINKYYIQFQQKANVVYSITYPDCYNKYISKTDWNIITRIDEHGTIRDQPVHQHLSNCAQFAEYLKFYAPPDIDSVNTIVRKELHHTKIIDHNNRWTHFQYLTLIILKQCHLKLILDWQE